MVLQPKRKDVARVQLYLFYYMRAHSSLKKSQLFWCFVASSKLRAWIGHAVPSTAPSLAARKGARACVNAQNSVWMCKIMCKCSTFCVNAKNSVRLCKVLYQCSTFCVNAQNSVSMLKMLCQCAKFCVNAQNPVSMRKILRFEHIFLMFNIFWIKCCLWVFCDKFEN